MEGARGSHSLSIHCTATVISTNTSLSSAAARAFSRRSTSRSVLADGGDGNADGDGDVCRARGLNPFAGADGAAGFARCRWPLAAGRWLGAQLGATYQGRAENIAGVSTGWQRLTRRSAQPRGEHAVGSAGRWLSQRPPLDSEAALRWGRWHTALVCETSWILRGSEGAAAHYSVTRCGGTALAMRRVQPIIMVFRRTLRSASASGVRSGWISGGSQPFGVVLEGAGLPD